ncbi:hypothetical protein O0I10_010352 [Lichtheimia ornata]|uniref:Zn(2)-C6 fungal-type domain-containing protein n=1 Tax=Lichtheimia ornata TaxID=688661 RepID=A0AAD7UW25_9FUNG|nr:uncharacterized protein O0I10_010352 [Lichtheimia ornata]KAJ8654016.1 hypothetical protein O0I10_010352 [Lichtheimia ornata]
MSFSSPSSSHHATNLQCILGEESRLHYAVMHKNIQDANGTTIPPPSLSRSKSTGSFSSSVPPRRLSSGSACEVCRRRKTKCDGGNPCAFCSANRIECVHRATRRKKSSLAISQTNNDLCKASSSSNKPSTTTTTTTSTGFQLQEATPSPTASSPSWANTASTTSPAQSTTTHMTSLTYQSARAFPAAAVGGTTNTTTANRYNMEGYIKSHLSKQTSCPSLIVSTHWSPNHHQQQHAADPIVRPPSTPAAAAQPPPPGSATAAAVAVAPNHDPSVGNFNAQQDDNQYSRTKTEMPSMMDQLSCRTFSAVVDHRTDYPIYPLSHSTTATAPNNSNTHHPPTNHHHGMMLSGNGPSSVNYDED